MRALLHDLNMNEEWRSIYGPEDGRMRDQELVLRFLAFYYEAANYKSPLVNFLNAFMGRYKQLEQPRANEMKKVFSDTRSELELGTHMPSSVAWNSLRSPSKHKLRDFRRQFGLALMPKVVSSGVLGNLNPYDSITMPAPLDPSKLWLFDDQGLGRKEPT
jgi:hypothetical protein